MRNGYRDRKLQPRRYHFREVQHLSLKAIETNLQTKIQNVPANSVASKL